MDSKAGFCQWKSFLDGTRARVQLVYNYYMGDNSFCPHEKYISNQKVNTNNSRNVQMSLSTIKAFITSLLLAPRRLTERPRVRQPLARPLHRCGLNSWPASRWVCPGLVMRFGRVGHDWYNDNLKCTLFYHLRVGRDAKVTIEVEMKIKCQVLKG